MSHMFRRCLSALCALGLLIAVIVAGPAQAQSPIVLDTWVVDSSHAVVNGSVISERVVLVRDVPHTVWEVDVDETVLGDDLPPVQVVTIGGPHPNGMRLIVSHQAPLAMGAEVQLGLTPVAPNLRNQAGLGDQAYLVAGGAAGAASLNGLALGPQGAGDYMLVGPSWDSFGSGVGYRVNPDNSGMTAGATVNAAQRGFDLWENDSGSLINFTFLGTTNKTQAGGSDGLNTVTFNSNPPSFAQARFWVNGANEIVEFDIEVDPAFGVADGPQSGKYDLATTVAHEAGHAVGLTHTIQTDPNHPYPPANELMFWSITQGAGPKSLGAGDKDGVAVLYPAPTAPVITSCDDVDPSGYNVIDMNTGASGIGTPGNDLILGTNNPDRIKGFGGNDVLCGRGGIDRIEGGSGEDLIFGEGGSDRIWGDADDDVIWAGSGADKVYGGSGDDQLFGQGGQDRLYGHAGNDTLQGNSQSDRIDGGDGNDILRGSSGKDEMYGGAGNDELYGGDNTDYLDGGPGNNDLADGQRGRDNPIVPGVSGCVAAEQRVSC